MRIALVLSLAAFAAGCAREPEPVVFPEPAPVVTAEPVFTGKI